MIKFVSNLRKRFIKKIQTFVYQNSCRLKIHSLPKWCRSGSNPNAIYWGICQNCNEQTTPNYSFKDFTGPLYEGIVPNKYGYRDLAAIINKCIQMFLNNE